MEPLLDRLVRLKKKNPRIIQLIGAFMFLMPSLVFFIGNNFGYPEISAVPFLISILVAIFSPFVVFSGKKRSTVIIFALVFWGLLFIQILFVILLGNLNVNHGQLINPA